MFNYVRLSDGGAAAASGEMRSEVEIIAALAEAVLPPGPLDWGALRDHAAHPAGDRAGRPRLRRDRRRSTGRAPSSTSPAGPSTTPRFATPDGRARMRPTPLPEFAPGPGELRLMTLRSEGQFNTVVYEEEDLYRGNERRDVVMMAPATPHGWASCATPACASRTRPARWRCWCGSRPAAREPRDVLPRGERAGPAPARPALGDAGLQVDDGARGPARRLATTAPRGEGCFVAPSPRTI